jgi:hypothetical protein
VEQIIMREIPLTRGYVAVVDDADYDRVMAAGLWFARVEPHTVYAQRNVRKPDGTDTAQYLHRFIAGELNPAVLIDHRDRNGLHNWRSNLRKATPSQSQANHGKQRGTTSQYRGVYRRKDCARWEARIRQNGKQKRLGLYVSEVDAALAYDKAAREIHGEFASCNFPPKMPGATAAQTDYSAVVSL